MMSMLRKAAAAAGIFGLALAAAPAAFAADGEATLTRAAFGLFTPAAGGPPDFEATNRIPNVAGQVYGWILAVKTASPTIRWKEELVLPEAPRSWDDSKSPADHALSADRRVSTTEGTAANDKGLISHSWTVAPGDPSGAYEMRVFVEGRLLQTFRFVVE